MSKPAKTEMSKKANGRHQSFKSELRAYHDSINRKNRYNLPKLTGKLNIFEGEGETEGDSDNGEKLPKISIDRRIPNTALTVLERDDGLQAIGNLDGKPITEFRYSFIEGSLGEEKKVISCITDDGKIEYFDVENEVLLECDMGGAIGVGSLASGGTGNIGDDGETSKNDEHEIDYNKVRDGLMIPYLSGYRIKDMRSGRLLSKGVKRGKRRRRKANRR